MVDSLMKEDWKCVSMKHGEQYVITLSHITGMLLKQMWSVGSWDILEQVRKYHPLTVNYVSIILIFQMLLLSSLEMEVCLPF